MIIIVMILLVMLVMEFETVIKPNSTFGMSAEFLWTNNSEQIIEAANILLSTLPNATVVDEWLYLVRQSRHPNYLWDINYIKPSTILLQVNKLIKESEKILFNHIDDIELKKQYQCGPDALLLFNVIRAHVDAEQGQIEHSMLLWDKLYNMNVSSISLIRQCNLFMHLYTVFLCTKQFDKAYSCYLKLLSMIKISSLKTQHEMGILDNICLVSHIQNFFVRHVPEFLVFLSTRLNVSDRSLLIHKKTMALELMPLQLIIQVCSRSFYDHARSLMPLPDYNIDEFLMANKPLPMKAESEWHVKYNEVLGSQYSTKLEISARKWDLIWHTIVNKPVDKYLQEQNDYTVDLIDFLDDVNLDYSSVLDVGCGIASKPMQYFHDRTLTRIDISNFIANYWLAKNPIIEASAEEFFSRVTQNFDLCFCSMCLPAMIDPMHFLEQCKLRCKYLVASIQHSTDGLRPVSSQLVKAWHDNVDADTWVKRVTNYFDIKHITQIDSNILVIGLARL